MIELFCPRCGAVGVARDEVHLELWRAGRANTYRFVCPVCSELVVKPAGASVLRALEETGPAANGRETSPLPDAPPLTPDDLLDFHFQLRSDEAVAAFLDPNTAAYEPLP
jgi:hypothetical protein